MCVRHLRGKDRAVVAFDRDDAWVLVVGPHDEDNRRADVYTALYELADVTPPDEPRTKPSCCDENEEPPELDGAVVDDLVRRARGQRR